ncbi:hypothetical protein CCH79_00012847 [Gambusia affinis]|uniref:Uncharacterized protein n=1 Tax=Gambusia affinis TaxID=33528 RepID=A0A315W1Y5_GAMAF|nr:hypothetical protein CCH79_00012847 [Gambusia affinis]
MNLIITLYPLRAQAEVSPTHHRDRVRQATNDQTRFIAKDDVVAISVHSCGRGRNFAAGGKELKDVETKLVNTRPYKKEKANVRSAIIPWIRDALGGCDAVDFRALSCCSSLRRKDLTFLSLCLDLRPWLTLKKEGQTARRAKVGGVRFPEELSSVGATSHVHFDEKLHDSVVMVTMEEDGNFMVKVGFLKTQHRYEIVFTLPEVPAVGKDVCPAPLPNPHLKITDISAAPEGGLKITCEYLALQEGVLCEEVLLLSETSDDVCIRVKVHARVMDRHHGTPMLLEGVRCIGTELEYDSEQSDWQGFD